jgi:hypothetical protein
VDPAVEHFFTPSLDGVKVCHLCGTAPADFWHMLGCPVTAPSLIPLIDAITTLVQGLAVLSKPATAVIPLLRDWLAEVASLDPTSAGPPTFVDQLTAHENPPETPDVSGVRWAFFISSASGAHALRVKLPATRTLLCIPAGRFPGCGHGTALLLPLPGSALLGERSTLPPPRLPGQTRHHTSGYHPRRNV